MLEAKKVVGGRRARCSGRERGKDKRGRCLGPVLGSGMVRCGDGCGGMGVKVLRRTGDGEVWGLIYWSGHWW